MTKLVLNEEAAKDATFKKIYRAYEKFRKNNEAWNEISEATYAKARKL